MGNALLEHAFPTRRASDLSLEHVLSRRQHWEPQLTILAFSVNDCLPDLPKFLRNGLLGLGTRYGNERRIILKLKHVLLLDIHREPLLKFLTFSNNEHLPYHPKFLRNG